MATGDRLRRIDLHSEDEANPENEIAGALDQVHVAISNMQAVLRHPMLPTKLTDDLQNRRRATVRVIMMIREIRDNHLGTDLFHDPAWNMLLDCYASDLDGRRISVSDACVASGVPHTTALRWLRVLEERGLVERKDDINDRRRAFISLTSQARKSVESLIDQTIKSLGGGYNHPLPTTLSTE